MGREKDSLWYKALEASRFRDGAIKATAVCVLIGDSWSQVLTN